MTYRNTYETRTGRRLAAIALFVVLYIAVPLLAVIAILSLNAMATNAANNANAAYNEIAP
jgi:hypothetical protein